MPSSRCVAAGAESFCGRSCAAGSPYGTGCPTGYACTAVDGGPAQCTPTSGTCRCGPDEVGVQRACPVGECTGLQACEAVGGGEYAFSECSAVGLIPEVCDGLDNDCNGQIDEGFVDGSGLYTTDEHCGDCGNNCLLRWSVAVHHATGACGGGDEPRCVIAACATESDSGIDYEWVDVNGRDADGCECRRVAGNVDADPPEVDFGDDYPDVGAVYVDANCDGVDGVVAHALFVSAGNPVAGDGSLASPFKTINAALAALPTSMKDYILVAAGDYDENIILTKGVQLHGGYAPDFQSRNIATFETRINGQEPELLGGSVVPGTVHAAGITGNGPETVLSGFVIRGYDVSAVPADPGATGFSSYAVYVLDSDDALVIANNRVIGGLGGDGAPGANGANGFGASSQGGGSLVGRPGVSVEAGSGVCTASGDCPGGTQRNGGAPGRDGQPRGEPQPAPPGALEGDGEDERREEKGLLRRPGMQEDSEVSSWLPGLLSNPLGSAA